MGADQRLIGEVGDEPVEHPGRHLALSRVEMADRLGCMGQDDHPRPRGRVDDGRHHLPVAQVVALAIGVQLADASRPCCGAPLDLLHRLSPGHRVDRAERDEPVRVTPRGVEDVLVGLPAQVVGGPADVDQERPVDIAPVHAFEQRLGRAERRIGVSIEGAIGEVAAQVMAPFRGQAGREDMGMSVDPHDPPAYQTPARRCSVGRLADARFRRAGNGRRVMDSAPAGGYNSTLPNHRSGPTHIRPVRC